MKKTNYMKSIFLLCLLLAGAVNAHADDYEWVKVTDLSKVESGETVLLVDQSKNLALSPLNGPYGIGLKGVDVAIGEDNVIRNVSADMIWTIGSKSGNSFTFNNNGKPLNGSLSSSSVSVTNEPYGQNTKEFFLDEYGDNGGKLYYVGNTNYEKAMVAHQEIPATKMRFLNLKTFLPSPVSYTMHGKTTTKRLTFLQTIKKL